MHGAMRGVRPHHVIALVWAANFAGAMVLLVEYVVVLPFPPEASTNEVVRSNVVLGIACIVLSWIVLAAVGVPVPTGRWAGPCAGPTPTRTSSG